MTSPRANLMVILFSLSAVVGGVELTLGSFSLAIWILSSGSLKMLHVINLYLHLSHNSLKAIDMGLVDTQKSIYILDTILSEKRYLDTRYRYRVVVLNRSL